MKSLVGASADYLKRTTFARQTGPGAFQQTVSSLNAGGMFEYLAVVETAAQTTFGRELVLETK